jgi:DNA-binding PadR family transcriptional regulator
MTATALEPALLGFVRQRPMHAYEIHRALTQNRALGMVWRLKQGQLYALLAHLEAEGYLASRIEQQGSRPPRKMLYLTDSGRAVLARWLAEPVAHGREFRQEFLAKLFFARQAEDPTTLATLLARQRATCRARLDSLRAQAAAAREAYDQLVLAFRIGQLEQILVWLDTCEATLTAPPDPRRGG